MAALKQKFVQMGVTHRKNVSVPNPADADTGIVEQVYIPIYQKLSGPSLGF